MTHIPEFIQLASLIVVVLVLLTAGFLTFLYYQVAYKKMKRSKIILSIALLCLAIGVKYGYLAMLHTAGLFHLEMQKQVLENFSLVTNVFMFLALGYFLRWTVNNEKVAVKDINRNR